LIATIVVTRVPEAIKTSTSTIMHFLSLAYGEKTLRGYHVGHQKAGPENSYQNNNSPSHRDDGKLLFSDNARCRSRRPEAIKNETSSEPISIVISALVPELSLPEKEENTPLCLLVVRSITLFSVYGALRIIFFYLRTGSPLPPHICS
jgi:hypothetical protein